MKRTRINRILLLAALLHLFADVVAAGGAVLCVGPDDHVAVEIGHLAPGCDAPGIATTATTSSAIASASDDCIGCTDTALHADAEIGSKRFTWDASPPAVLVASFHTRTLLALPVGPRTPASRLGLSTTMRAHRSIVLLI